MICPIHARSKTLNSADILTADALAARWGKSVRTLQRMRDRNDGPPWFAIGRTVFYRLPDVLSFEEIEAQKEKV